MARSVEGVNTEEEPESLFFKITQEFTLSDMLAIMSGNFAAV